MHISLHIYGHFSSLFRPFAPCTSLAHPCIIYCTSTTPQFAHVFPILSLTSPLPPFYFADTPYRRLTNGIATTILFFASAATLRLSADGQRKRSRRGAQTAASASSRRLTRVRFAVCTLRFSLHSHKIIVFVIVLSLFCHFLSFFCHFLSLFCYFFAFFFHFLPLFCLFPTTSALFLSL